MSICPREAHPICAEQSGWLLLVLSSAISFIACVIPLFFYHITEDKQRWYVAEIQKRKEAEAEEQALALANAGAAEVEIDIEIKE